MSVSVFNGDVLALDIAEIVESLLKRRDVGLGRRLRFYRDQDTDPPHLPRLLRLGGEWRRECSENEPAKERSPVHHWMISSARTKIDCGMVSPSDFAVFMLMTSSNFVGCSTGRSAGLAPFRILSTK